MCKTQLDATMTLRLFEADGYVLVTVDGAFRSRTFRIPIEDATLFLGAGTYDCRAIVFRSDRAGGKLRALYPWTYGELQVRHKLRDLRDDSLNQTAAEIVCVEEPMEDRELEERWTTLWEPTDETESEAEEETDEH